MTHSHDSVFEANGSQVEMHPHPPRLTDHMHQQGLVENPACVTCIGQQVCVAYTGYARLTCM